MGQLSKVHKLNADDKKWLDEELVRRHFSGYDELEKLCLERGIEISSSSIHRYGQSFKERMDLISVVTEQAKAVVEQSPDDEGAINEALMRLVQEKLFSLLMNVEKANSIDIPKVAKAIADLGRASVSQKRLAAEAREQARQELLKEQEERLDELRGSDGMSEQLESRIRGILLGKAG